MSVTRITIGLIPTPDVANEAYALSAEFHQHHSFFTLTQKGPSPHITLYMTDLPTTQVETVPKLLTSLLPWFALVSLTGKKFRLQANGYIDVEYEVTPSLLSLQSAIVERIAPLREGLEAHADIFETLSIEPQNAVLRFGYPDYGILFTPHLTLTRVQAGTTLVVPEQYKVENFSCTPHTLGIFITGPNGTCIQNIAQLSLS